MWYLYYCWRKNYSSKRLDDFIQNNFTTEDGDKRSLKKVMRRFWLWRGVHHSDFHEMSLDKKSEKERRLFVPRWEEVDLYYQINNQQYINILRNKWNCYKYFEQYYKREIVLLSKENVMEKHINDDVLDFLKQHNKFIIKPLRLQGGKGVRIIEANDKSPKADNPLLEYLNLPEYSDGLVLEELIIQNERMATFHPESVNTIRIMTINFGDTIETKWPVLRLGKRNSFMDSFDGGIIAAIDEKKGTIIRAADKQRNSYYQIHPDTQKILIGFQIPLWDELCELVKKTASLCPECHILGWDMALTNQGWVIVECNYGAEIVAQWALNRGVRDEFEEIKKRLHAKKGNSYLHKTLEQYLAVPLNP